MLSDCDTKSIEAPKNNAKKKTARYYEQDAENILKRQFNPPAPNMVWASDITFINTAKGYVYLCVIIDLFARKVIA